MSPSGLACPRLSLANRRIAGDSRWERASHGHRAASYGTEGHRFASLSGALGVRRRKAARTRLIAGKTARSGGHRQWRRGRDASQCGLCGTSWSHFGRSEHDRGAGRGRRSVGPCSRPPLCGPFAAVAGGPGDGGLSALQRGSRPSGRLRSSRGSPGCVSVVCTRRAVPHARRSRLTRSSAEAAGGVRREPSGPSAVCQACR